MSDDTLIIRVESDLKSAFADAARASDRTASQLLRDFMRDYVKRQAGLPDYETWVREKVAAGLRDVERGEVIDNHDVENAMAERRRAARAKVAR